MSIYLSWRFTFPQREAPKKLLDLKKIVSGIALFTFTLVLLIYWMQLRGWLASGFLQWFTHWYDILLSVYASTIAFIIVILILEKNRPTKTLAWVLVIIFLPLIGLILYLFFGINRRKEKLFYSKGFSDLERIDAVSKQQLAILADPEEEDQLFSRYPHLVKKSMRLLLNNNRSLYTEQNEVTVLPGGPDKLQALLDDLDRARHHIHLEYYIIEDSEFGNTVRAKLMEKARQGVQVRIIIDGVGSWRLSRAFREGLTDAGVEIQEFMPVRFPLLTSPFNYRNHRKIIVIDGRVGYTGGINLSDRYLLGNHLGLWRDTHLRIEGDAVKMLQLIFQFDWYFITQEKLDTSLAFFPVVQLEARQLTQIVSSGPDSDYASIQQAYFHAVSAAQDYVYIATPYFIPDESITMAMQTAAMSGVDIRLMLPGLTDSKLVDYCSTSFLSELLRAGVKIYRYQPRFLHCKVVVADDCFASVGSANMDIRSFETNFEVNAILYEPSVVQTLKEQFLADLAESKRIILEEHHGRPWWRKALEGLARLLAPLL